MIGTAIALIVVGGACGNRQTEPPSALLQRAESLVADGKPVAFEWTFRSGGVTGRGSADLSGADLAYTYREGPVEYQYRRDALRGLGLRMDERLSHEGPPVPFHDLQLGERFDGRFPKFLFADLSENKGWKADESPQGVRFRTLTTAGMTGPATLRVEFGADERPVRFLASGASELSGEWRLTYRALRPFPPFRVPDGFMPDTLPVEGRPADIGTVFPGLPPGPRRVVLVTGDDAPSRKAAARTWTLPVVRRRAGDKGVPETSTPAIYLVSADGKVEHRWIGDDDTIAADIEAAIIGK